MSVPMPAAKAGQIAGGTTPAGVYSEFVALDIETTGLSAVNNKITEIGAVKVKDGTIVGEFKTLVNPGVPIPYHITKITGITDDMVKGAPSIASVLPKFLIFAGNIPIVAHNASFDMGFMKHNAQVIGLSFDNTVVCTLKLCRQIFKGLENHKLDTITRHLGVRLDQHHRAMADCMAAAQIYLKCLETLK